MDLIRVKIIATYGDCKDTIVVKVNPRKPAVDKNVDSERIEPSSIKELLESSNINNLNPEENNIDVQITPSASDNSITISIEPEKAQTEIADSTTMAKDSTQVKSVNN